MSVNDKLAGAFRDSTPADPFAGERFETNAAMEKLDEIEKRDPAAFREDFGGKHRIALAHYRDARDRASKRSGGAS